MTKDDPVLGHHAVVSAADYRSQKAILGVLGRAMPGVPVVCEEMAEDAPARSEEAIRRRFIVDELEGSASFVAGHQEGGPPPSAAVGYYLPRFGNSILATA